MWAARQRSQPAARKAQIRLVHVSSVDALGLPPGGQPADEETPLGGGVLCPYVVTKRAAEQVVLAEVAAGLDAVIVNPAYMVGPWDWKPSSGRMLLEVARNRALFAPLGTNNFCDVRDVAAGVLTAADRGVAGRRYILGGERLSYFQAWRIFARVTRSIPPLFPAGPLVRVAAGRWGDLMTRWTGREGDINSAVTTSSAQTRNFQSTRAAARARLPLAPARRVGRRRLAMVPRVRLRPASSAPAECRGCAAAASVLSCKFVATRDTTAKHASGLTAMTSVES